MQDKLTKAREFFQANPDINLVLTTSDGTVFLPENKRHANNHAATLDRKVTSVTRDEALEVEDPEPEKAPVKKPAKGKAKEKAEETPEATDEGEQSDADGEGETPDSVTDKNPAEGKTTKS